MILDVWLIHSMLTLLFTMHLHVCGFLLGVMEHALGLSAVLGR